MLNQENLLAVEGVIREFVKRQFTNNRISPIDAQLIMKSVYCETLNESFNSFVMSRVETGPPPGPGKDSPGKNDTPEQDGREE